MTDTDLDQAIDEQLAALVAQAPLAPTVDEIVGGRPLAGSGHRPVLLATAAAFVLLAVGAAVLLRQQADDDRPSTADAMPVRSEPDLVVVMNVDPTDAQVGLVADLLDDPLVTESVFIEVDQAYEDVVSGLEPHLLEGVVPEAVHTSFRVSVVDHDLDQAQSLVVTLRTAPGVRSVHLDPDPTEIPSILLPPGDVVHPSRNIIPLEPGEDCPEMYLPGDDNGDGVADTCMRVWDGGG